MYRILMTISIFLSLLVNSFAVEIDRELLSQLKQGENYLKEIGAKQQIQAYKIRKRYELKGHSGSKILPIKNFIQLLKRNKNFNKTNSKIVTHYENLLALYEKQLNKIQVTNEFSKSTIKSLNKPINLNNNKQDLSKSFGDLKFLKFENWFLTNKFLFLIFGVSIASLFYFLMRNEREVKIDKNTFEKVFKQYDIDTIEDEIELGINVKELLEEKLILKESFLVKKELNDIFVHSFGSPYFFGDGKKIESLIDSLIASIAKLKAQSEKSCDIKVIGKGNSHTLEITFNNIFVEVDYEFSHLVRECFQDVKTHLGPLYGNLNFDLKHSDGINEFLILVDYKTGKDLFQNSDSQAPN